MEEKIVTMIEVRVDEKQKGSDRLAGALTFQLFDRGSGVFVEEVNATGVDGQLHVRPITRR